MSWAPYVGVSVASFAAFTAAADWICRRRFGHFRIGGADRPRARHDRRLLLALFVLNSAQVGMAIYAVKELDRRGLTQLEHRPIAGVGGVARLLLELLLILLILDTNFYWMHRLMHAHKSLFVKLHRIHHTVRFPTAWTLSYQHPLDYLVTTVAPMCWVSLLPLHVSVTAYAVAMVIANFINIVGHSGYEVGDTFLGAASFNGWATYVDPARTGLARWVTNVLHHDLHHQTCERNFALYFTFWDRWCDTFRAETDRVEPYLTRSWNAWKRR